MSDDAPIARAIAQQKDVAIERLHVARDIAMVISLVIGGTALALTGHDQVAGTVFGGLLAYMVPSTGRLPRATIALLGSVAGALYFGA